MSLPTCEYCAAPATHEVYWGRSEDDWCAVTFYVCSDHAEDTPGTSELDPAEWEDDEEAT